MAPSAVGMMASGSTLSSSASTNCSLLDCTTSSTYGWMSPRISFSRDDDHHIASSPSISNNIVNTKKQQHGGGGCEEEEVMVEEEEKEEEGDIVLDFEFRLNDANPMTMLPADELFSDGKLVPLQLKPTPLPLPASTGSSNSITLPPSRVEISNSPQSAGILLVADQCVFSPKMPVRCTGRWKELLGLRKSSSSSSPSSNRQRHSTPQNHQTTTSATAPILTTPPSPTAATPSASPNTNQTLLVRGLKQYFLNRNSKTATSSSSSSSVEVAATSLGGGGSTQSYISLLRDSSSSSSSSADSSCRLSHSSSSSSSVFDHDDLQRVSLDCCFDKQPHRHNLPPSSSSKPPCLQRRPSSPAQHQSASPLSAARVRRTTTATTTSTVSPRASLDSPRMNSYGKIVFQSLERSSSSPGSFYAKNGTGGRRIRGGKHHQPHLNRAMGGGGSCLSVERSYSSNNVVHVTPVLNVIPLRPSSSSSTFGFLSHQRKDSTAATTRGVSKGGAAIVANTSAAVGTTGSKGRDCVLVGK